VIHLSNTEPCTWWDFARAILDATGHKDLAIDRISSDTLDLPAVRPLYCVLDCSRLERLGIERRPWQEGLADYLELSADAPLRAALAGARLKDSTS
jgi:dTDP-4-dehydrorhamnose reductase